MPRLPTPTPTDRFAAAISRFDAMHEEDPRQDLVDGQPVSRELLYARRLSAWIDRLVEQPSEALRLAARCQHLRRWRLPRANFPPTRAGYHRWRSEAARQHAELAREVLAELGYDAAMQVRVESLVLKKDRATDYEAQCLEDAICLAFLQHELRDFSAAHATDKVVDILRKTWRKMSPHGHQIALQLQLDEPSRLLVALALAS